MKSVRHRFNIPVLRSKEYEGKVGKGYLGVRLPLREGGGWPAHFLGFVRSPLLLVRSRYVKTSSALGQTRWLASVAERVLYVLVVVHRGVDVVQRRPETLPRLAARRRPCLGLHHPLLLAPVELFPAEGVDEHRVLFEILFQGILLHQKMSIFVIDQNFLILQVVYGLVVDIVDRVCVVQRIWRCLLPGKSQCRKSSASNFHHCVIITVHKRPKGKPRTYCYLVFFLVKHTTANNI